MPTLRGVHPTSEAKMKTFLLAIALLSLSLTNTVNGAEVVATVPGSALADACECARTGRMAHLGHNRGCYEGVGVASTRLRAIARCCYWNVRTPIEIACVQGRCGRWFAVVRYR